MKSITYSFEYYPPDDEALFIEAQIEMDNPEYIPSINEGVCFGEEYIHSKLPIECNNITSHDWVVVSRFYIPDEDRMFVTLGVTGNIN